MLVSIDTLRADHLGVYGYPADVSPNLDRLAERSAVFWRAVASNPVTLPSHATLMTGLHPPAHGVHDNTTFRLPDDLDTLAETLAAHGLRTGAVIGSLALDARFGLDQGFEWYDDDIRGDGRDGEQVYFPERRARAVSDLAIESLRAHRDERFFLFVHYYDPHQGWNAPAAFRERFANGYEAEIAYTDQQVGRLLVEMEALGLADSTLVVVTSDHGEGLGARGELGHSFFIYQETQWIPLLVHVPGMDRRVDVRNAVGLVDVAPTVLDLLGAPAPGRTQGRSLRPLWEEPGSDWEDRVLYAESIGPTKIGCNPLLAVVDDRWKYLRGAAPSLFDLERDPGESRNLASSEPDRVAAMDRALEDLLEATPRGVDARFDVDSATRQGLEALGYIGRAGDPSLRVDPQRDDAPDCIDVFVRYGDLQLHTRAGRTREAREAARWLTARRPGMADVYRLLGDVANREGEFEEAASHYQLFLALAEADDERPPDATLTSAGRVGLGVAWASLGRPEEAMRAFDRALEDAPTFAPAHFNRGVLLRELGRTSEARASFEHALALDPDYEAAAAALAALPTAARAAGGPSS